MNLSYQQILYLISLAEHKHFGRAAAACFVTQPTLSMQVKKAEESIGFQLINRGRNPVELTDFGNKILPHLYEMQADYAEIKRISDQSVGNFREEIRIGIIPTVAAYLVPELFANKAVFSNQINWSVRELKSDEILEQLQRKSIDIGIMAGPVDLENMQFTSLYNEEILAYFPDNGKKTIQVRELEQAQPWLLNNGNCLRTQMVHFCKLKESAPSEWNYEGGNLEMLLKMAQKYGGYTLIPDFYTRVYPIREKDLKHIYDKSKTLFPARNVIGISSPKNRKNPDFEAIFKFIRQHFSNQKLKKFEILSWK